MKSKEIYEADLRFNDAVNKIYGVNRERCGIGTLSEKTLHAVLKNYIEPDEDKHEVKIEGYIADIFNDDGIIEIQTAQFNKIRNKLEKFLQKYPVTIVYPIPSTKWLIWIDEESGEYTKRRKSPKKGNPNLIFYELYKIKDYLLNNNLKLKILLIDIEEYRLLNGWSNDKKKGSFRFDSIPKDIVNEININKKDDYSKILPANLSMEFTTKDYQKAAGISLKAAQISLRILNYIGIVKKVGKKGNLIIYTENPAQ